MMRQFPGRKRRHWRALAEEMTVADAAHLKHGTVDGALQIHEVLPQVTDRAIDNWLEPHYAVVDQSVPLRNQLVIFLPGSFGKVTRQQLIIRQLARLGYHIVNLSYPNSWTVASLCRGHADQDCLEKVRLEIITGRGECDVLRVGRANSVESRLIKLLAYLQAHYPQQNWGQYLDENLQPQWERTIVAGHSQGGGHAALLGKYHQVARVVMLAAPADFSWAIGEPAPWLSMPGQTPANRYYGFVHQQDEGYERIQKSWERLEMTAYGAIINVDGQPLPYQHSHCLTTHIIPARPDKYHGCVATDGATPKLADGTPVFRQVWQYLFDV